MKEPRNRDRHKYGGAHYLPPSSHKKKPGPDKGMTYARSSPHGGLTKIDAERMAMERDHLRKLARAHCDPIYAKENPALVRMIATLNDDMKAKLKRLYASKN